jgi:hypothetical protein
MIWSCDFTGVISLNSGRRLWKVIFRIETTERRSSYDCLDNIRRVGLKLILIWYPPARKTVYLVEFVHLGILYPNGTLRLACAGTVKEL